MLGGRGGEWRGEKGGKVAEIICKMFKRHEKQAICPGNCIYNSDYTLYLYDYIYMIKTRSSVFLLVFATYDFKIERLFLSSGVATP